MNKPRKQIMKKMQVQQIFVVILNMEKSNKHKHLSLQPKKLKTNPFDCLWLNSTNILHAPAFLE